MLCLAAAAAPPSCLPRLVPPCFHPMPPCLPPVLPPQEPLVYQPADRLFCVFAEYKPLEEDPLDGLLVS